MARRGKEILMKLLAPKWKQMAQIGMLSVHPSLDLKILIQVYILFIACDFINILVFKKGIYYPNSQEL